MIRWVSPAQTWSESQPRMLIEHGNKRSSSSRPTSFTHHGGNELGDDGAPLPHLTLLAVGEVGEDTRDASGTGCPARVHHDQHLHYGGVHISDSVRGRWRGQREAKQRQKGEKQQVNEMF